AAAEVQAQADARLQVPQHGRVDDLHGQESIPLALAPREHQVIAGRAQECKTDLQPCPGLTTEAQRTQRRKTRSWGGLRRLGRRYDYKLLCWLVLSVSSVPLWLVLRPGHRERLCHALPFRRRAIARVAGGARPRRRGHVAGEPAAARAAEGEVRLR